MIIAHKRLEILFQNGFKYHHQTLKSSFEKVLKIVKNVNSSKKWNCQSSRPKAGFRSTSRLLGNNTMSISKKSYVFDVGAAAKPKSTDLPIIPKPEPPYTSIQVGEDAFFSRNDSMGVADGVGGWSEVKGSLSNSTSDSLCAFVGANPALYSLKLMHYAKLQFEQYDDLVGELEDKFQLVEEYDKVSPKTILATSYEYTNNDAKAENIIGSTTALILVLRVSH